MESALYGIYARVVDVSEIERVSAALSMKYSLYTILYCTHTEKYSPKSCVVNFDTQMSSSQSEE